MASTEDGPRRLLLSESDSKAGALIAKALSEGRTVRTTAGDTMSLERALRASRCDAVVLGGPVETIHDRAQLVRSSAPDVRIVIFAADSSPSDASVRESILKLGASFVPVYSDAFQGGELNPTIARSLERRLTVLLKDGPDAKRGGGAATAKPRTAPRNPAVRVQLAVVAASTGGPNVLREVFDELPASIQQPIVVVQHMPAGFVQGLADRLDRTCALKVKVAEEGEVLAPSTIYIAAGGRHLALEAGESGLVARYNDAPPVHSCRPAADVLFASAVRLYRGDVVGVVLTGMGADGANGCQEIKEHGGAVLVQDEETSTVWGMPGAVVERNAADEVLPPKSLASSLVARLMNTGRALRERRSAEPGAAPTPTWSLAEERPAAVSDLLRKSKPEFTAKVDAAQAALSQEDFQFICQFVKENSAIALEGGKEYLVQIRLEPLAKKAGLSGVAGLVQELRRVRSGPLAKAVIEAMTTNETMFFRDGTPFALMRETLIPEVIARSGASKRLRIWCAAASTGQEPYSIAMTLRDQIPDIDRWDVEIRASDISKDVLEKARSGVYNQLEISRGLPAPLMAKYFEKKGLSWIVKEELRSMVRFEQLNLIGPWPHFEPLDFLFIRNVLIYFDLETKQRILNKARSLLKPDGVLFLGSAETTIGLVDGFDRQGLEKGSAYRRAG